MAAGGVLSRAAAVAVLPALLGACSAGENEHHAIIEAAWQIEADYQRTTRANLERDLVAKVVEQREGPCVIITAKPGNDIMGGDSTYCFARGSTKVRWKEVPAN